MLIIWTFTNASRAARNALGGHMRPTGRMWNCMHIETNIYSMQNFLAGNTSGD